MSISEAFPNYDAEPFIETSPQTPFYNCIAWAFGDDTRWYWPTEHPRHYWPPNIRRELDVQSFIELYQLAGYNVCDNMDLEIGIEKVAIFTFADGEPTHAAKQLPNGNWTSKIGEWHDVEHTVNSISGGMYGNMAVIMSRQSQP